MTSDRSEESLLDELRKDREPAPRIRLRMPAISDGHCAVCGEPWEIGDMIAIIPGGEPAHLDCLDRA